MPAMTDADTIASVARGLLELADRCEAATGPDRDLSYDILCVRDPRAVASGPVHYDPDYTVSLDAAMTLVPNGLRLQLGEWDDEKHLRPRGAWQVILTKAGAEASFSDIIGHRCDHAATPALALCCAALRARAHLLSEDPA